MKNFAELRRRPRRRVPAILVASVLLVLGLGALALAVSLLTTGLLPVVVVQAMTALQTTPWRSPLVLTVAATAALLGLVLVLAALIPARDRVLTLTTPTGDQVGAAAAFMAPRGLIRLAASYAAQFDGVESSSATLAGRHLRVRVFSVLTDRRSLSREIEAGLARRLAAAGVSPVPTVTVTALRGRGTP